MRAAGSEGLLRILGHALDLQRKDPLGSHHFRDAGGDHAQVFAAGEHAGGAEQLGQLAQGLLLPVMVVAAVEEVVVHPVEGLAAPLVQAGVGFRLAAVDAGMPASGTVRVLQEKVQRQPLRLYFALGEGERGAEMPHQAALFRLGDLPDAEEAQDVVDAESVEVLGHGAQAGLPPGIAVLGHRIPVVGREAPVLAVFREGVRRCAGL